MAGIAERLADVVGNAFLDEARVVEVGRPAPGFVTVVLQADAFRRAAWSPGAKVQLRPRRGTMALRTYTPIRWDTAEGTTALVAFTHGEGPGAGWFGSVSAGDPCEVLGPRKSVDLTASRGRVVFVGDESSVGLACAMQTLNPRVGYVFEASDPAGLTAVLAGLGLTGTVVERTADRAELLAQARAAAADAEVDLVVTGDAATVHAVRRDARDWPRRPGRITGKAYWAAGRTGLD